MYRTGNVHRRFTHLHIHLVPIEIRMYVGLGWGRCVCVGGEWVGGWCLRNFDGKRAIMDMPITFNIAWPT